MTLFVGKKVKISKQCIKNDLESTRELYQAGVDENSIGTVIPSKNPMTLFMWMVDFGDGIHLGFEEYELIEESQDATARCV